MKIPDRTIFLSIALAAGVAGCGGTAATVTGTHMPGSNPCGSLETNTVYFLSDYHPSLSRKPRYYFHEGKVSNLTFNETGWASAYSVYNYQAYVSGNSLNICVNRSGSVNPIDAIMAWFTENGVPWSGRNALGLQTYGDALPKDLNFAVEGTLGFTFPNSSSVWSCPVILAQGHSGLHNNWWMFTTQNVPSYSDNFAVLCSINGSKPSTTVVSPGSQDTDDQFMFETPQG